MAGIGFELKKLFEKKSLLAYARATAYSTAVTVGPTLLCIVMLTVLQQILARFRIPFIQRELFMAATVYSFIFSLLLTCGFSMTASRYVADKLYKKEPANIVPSLYGLMTLCVTVGGVVGGIFYLNSPLEPFFKLAAYLLFIELTMLWLQFAYMSAVRDYKRVLGGFLSGVAMILLLAFALVGRFRENAAMGVLWAMDAGFLVMLVFFMVSLKSTFRISGGSYFEILGYLDRYPALFALSVCCTLGMYVHNFVFWAGRFQVRAGGTYVFAPMYDVPAFWSFISILPALVAFVITVETSFYSKYRDYFGMVSGGGTGRDIRWAKQEMLRTLSGGIKYVMQLQLFFTVIFIILGIDFLPGFGFTLASVDLFNVLVVGNYAYVILFIVVLILLYFDDQKGALLLTALFLGLNASLTAVTVFLGESYYGLGFLLASFLAMLAGLVRLFRYMDHIDYHTYCYQPLHPKDRSGFFTWLSQKLG